MNKRIPPVVTYVAGIIGTLFVGAIILSGCGARVEGSGEELGSASFVGQTTRAGSIDPVVPVRPLVCVAGGVSYSPGIVGSDAIGVEVLGADGSKSVFVPSHPGSAADCPTGDVCTIVVGCPSPGHQGPFCTLDGACQ